MQGVQSTRLPGSKGELSPKTPKENVLVGKANLPSSGSKLSNREPHQRSYKESNVSKKKRVMLERTEGATELKNLPTPIGLYEDECAFCHSFRTSPFHGPMVRYLKGRILSIDEGNPSNGIYVHRNCLEWAPQVWFESDIVMNLEPEIRRASRLRCHRCGLPGAALGCYYETCKKSFHVPCAVQIQGCRWDVDGKLVLCPEHVSKPLPCDMLISQEKKRDKFSSLPQSQCLHKEEYCTTFQGEDQQIDHLHTQNSFLPSCFYNCVLCSRNFGDFRGESQQTVKLNASSSTLPQSQCSHKEALSAHSSREGRQMDQLTASSSCARLRYHPKKGISSAAYRIDEIKTEQFDASSGPLNQWVLLGFDLSASEEDSFQSFASWTKSTVSNGWAHNVTHVIVGEYAGSAWSRSYEVLMAILFGKWIVHAQWMMNVSLGMRPDLEDSYEVTFSDDSRGTLDGPKKGRARVAEGGPKLFSGLHFCLSAYMNHGERGRMQRLIAAGGGVLLEGSSSLQHLRRGDPSVKPYFVYDCGPPAKFSSTVLRMETEEARKHAAAGARVITHLRVMDAVAAYDAGILDQKGVRV